jgi:hypothetical protein
MKKDFWCVVALSEHGTGWIIQQSADAMACDLLPEDSSEDNGMNTEWEKAHGPGLYRLQLRPAGGGSDINGEFWTDIDVVAVIPLHVLTRSALIAPQEPAVSRGES